MLRLVLPSLLAIALFVVAIFAILLPGTRELAIDRKREMIRELTNAAWNVLGHFHRLETEGRMSRSAAQDAAIAVLRRFRYGPDNKDYLWITDLEPRMLMHPYRPDLEGRDLDDYRDSHGKRLFHQFVAGVADDGEAEVDYYWQHQDDATHIVPKLSYVRRFDPWDWIVGTGIYVEDVRAEIDRLTHHLWLLSAGIGLLIGGLLIVNGRIGLRIESRRQAAEAALRASRERYRALVDANEEGVLLLIDGQVRTANDRARRMLGHAPPVPIAAILPPDGAAAAMVAAPGSGSPRMASLRTADGGALDCLLVASPMRAFGRDSVVLTLKPLEAAPATGDGDAALEHLCADTGIGILRCAPGVQGRIVHANRACADILDHRHPQDLIGRSARRLFAGGVERGETLRRLANGEAIGGDVLTLRRRDGARVPVQVWGGVERDADHLVFLLHDYSAEHRRLDAGADALADHLHGHHPDQAGLAAIAERIAAADSAAALHACHDRVEALLLAQIDAGFGSRAVARCASDGADAILQRIIADELARRGPPPRPWCFLAVGSQGRREQTFATDQDNALVYADGDDSDGAPAWFRAFAAAINRTYADAGYPLCHGEAMARNPKWNQSLAAWQETFTTWIHHPHPQDLIDVNIFFDFRCVAGTGTLADALRTHLHATARGRDVFFLQLAEATLAFKPPLGLFGGLRLAQDGNGRRFDSKSAILPLSNFARLYALAHGIDATGTVERCDALGELGVFTPETCRRIRDALAFLLAARLAHQAAAIRAGRSPDNLLEPGALSDWDAAILKKIFTFFGHLQSRIRYDFGRQA